MAGRRTRLIVIGSALVILSAGAAAVMLTSGDDPIVDVSAAQHVIRFEAAGIEFSGWPEMAVSVNGEQIAIVAVENKVRQEYTFDVPAALGEVKTIEIRMTSDTNCKEAMFLDVHQCTDRTLILRKLWLNDEQIENPVATGERNFPWSIVSSDGAVTWTVDG